MKEQRPDHNLIGKVKKRTFSGVVCEQEVFYHIYPLKSLPDKTAEPRLRFQSAEERAAHRTAMSRKKFVQLVNTNFTPKSYYVTLTFDKENEVHEFDEAWQLLNNYKRRIKDKYPTVKMIYVIGRGKNTNRIHSHLLIDGVPKEVIAEKWGYGKVVDIQNLRVHNFYDGVDHGQDYTALAEYMFSHWTPEQGRHRYRRTRNLKLPEVEDYTEVKRNYSEEHPPKAPKGYKLVDVRITKYGYMYFKYVADTSLLPDRSGRRRC